LIHTAQLRAVPVVTIVHSRSVLVTPAAGTAAKNRVKMYDVAVYGATATLVVPKVYVGSGADAAQPE
jgi:hypothetical protein